MGLEDDFKLAADEAKTLPEKTSNEDKLKLYGLYKQGTEGDNLATPAPREDGAALLSRCVELRAGRPGMLDQKGRAKWDSWNNNKGTSKADAMSAYIKLVEDLKSKYA